MALYHHSQPVGLAKSLDGEISTSPAFKSHPFRQGGQGIKEKRRIPSIPEDAESDSKSVAVPSLSRDDSSRASSLNCHECRSQADDGGHWLPSDDEHTPVLQRSLSPISMEGLNIRRTAMDLGTLSIHQPCNSQQILASSEPWPRTIDDQDPRGDLQTPISSGTSLETSSAGRNLAVAARHPAIDSESSDSESESEDDSCNDDIDNDEWSGENDNIEAALYQAVYPDIDLAAHMISAMYPALALSYRNKIARKVSSWQEKTISNCPTAGSGTTITVQPAAQQESSNAGNGNHAKRDRQYNSSDNNIGDDEDEETDEPNRKKSKEQPNSEPGIPQPRLACPFWKKDSVKYSAMESGRKSCSGPGWISIAALKEHLSRAHRLVQCQRCYQKFTFKPDDRSSAESELERHDQQDDRCPRRSASLKEGINAKDWTLLMEVKKKVKKGKGKKVASPERTQSRSEQWYVIWAILFPQTQRPSTPWYPAPHPHGLPQNEHYLDVSKNINEHKLSELKDAVSSGSGDEVILALLLKIDQQKFSVWRSTLMVISDTTTDSFSNLAEHDLHSSTESGAWEKVSKDADTFQQSPSPLASNTVYTETEFTTPGEGSISIAPPNLVEAMMDRTNLRLHGNPQTMATNSTYHLGNVRGPPQLDGSRNTATPSLQDLIDAQQKSSSRSAMPVNQNLQRPSHDALYVGTSQAGFNYSMSAPGPAGQSPYGHANTWPMWSGEIQVPDDFDMTAFQPDLHPVSSNQWSDQYLTPSSRRFRRAP